MSKARVWDIPDEPGPGVTALRSVSGRLWIRDGQRWRLAGDRKPTRYESWERLIHGCAPLTDATAENPEAVS